MTCRLLEWLVFTFIFSSAKTHVVVMEVTGSVPAQLDHVFPSPPPFDIIGTRSQRPAQSTSLKRSLITSLFLANAGNSPADRDRVAASRFEMVIRHQNSDLPVCKFRNLD